MGSLRNLEPTERIRPALGQHDLLRRSGQHSVAGRSADPGALVQRRRLRDRLRQAVAGQPGAHVAVPLLPPAWTPPEQRRYRVDQGYPDQRGQEHPVPPGSPQRRQPPLLPEPEHDGDHGAERQGYRLRADQRFHPEQLRAPPPNGPALRVLNPRQPLTTTGADAVCPPLFLWTATRSRRNRSFK